MSCAIGGFFQVNFYRTLMYTILSNRRREVRVIHCDLIVTHNYSISFSCSIITHILFANIVVILLYCSACDLYND